MKFCADHWAKLRAAVDAAGLGVLVAEDTPEVMRKIQSQRQEGRITIDNFEPLLGAHNMILKHALDAAGAQVLQPNPDGSDRCPICFVGSLICPEHKVAEPEEAERWIELAANGQAQAWRELGGGGLSDCA